MADQASGYRAFPKEITHPSRAERLTEEAFLKLTGEEAQLDDKHLFGHAGA